MSDEMRLNLQRMPFLSNIRWGLVAKYVWLHLGLMVLFVGLGTFLVTDSGFPATTLVLPFMLLLSFPSGLGFALMASPFLGMPTMTDFFLLWFGMFVVGYFQWFCIVPNCRGGGIITLSLAKVERVTTEPHLSVNPAKEKPKLTRKGPLKIVHFDAAGRTPLERAIASRVRTSSRRTTLT